MAASGRSQDAVDLRAARERLSAQSSDWPFAITNGTTEEYARRGFLDHPRRRHDLLGDLANEALDGEKVAALEFMDALLPELDPALFA